VLVLALDNGEDAWLEELEELAVERRLELVLMNSMADM
jgi:hypothetical protein